MVQPKIRVVSAEIVRDGRYLLAQRSRHAVLPLLWEFPGGRVRDGESDADALRRSLRERIGCDGEVGEQLLTVTHAYRGYDLELVVYRCCIGGGEPTVGAVEAIDWVDPERFAELTFPGADQRTIDLLLSA